MEKFKSVDDYRNVINNAIPGLEVLSIIKRNRFLLNTCKQHCFDMKPEPESRLFGKKLYCVNCGGVMDATAAFEYANGFKAAGGNPNDVIENFE